MLRAIQIDEQIVLKLILIMLDGKTEGTDVMLGDSSGGISVRLNDARRQQLFDDELSSPPASVDDHPPPDQHLHHLQFPGHHEIIYRSVPPPSPAVRRISGGQVPARPR